VAKSEIQLCVLLAGPIAHNGRVQRTARTLSEFGSVVLVTSGGSESDQTLFDDRVEVVTTVRPVPSGLRKWILLHRQNDQLADAAVATGRTFDFVWANDYSTLTPALRLARRTDAKVIYDSHEIWLETINQFFPTDVPTLKRVIFRAIVAACRATGNVVEPALARRTNAIVTANQSFAEVLQQRLGRDEIGVVLNTPELTPLVRSDRLRKAFCLTESDHIVLYQGLMNPGRGLRELIQSVRHLPSQVKLVMLGEGMLLPSLRRLVQELDLSDRVLLPGSVPQAELHEWTASADLGVLILDPINLSKRLALANKIFEYMGAGIPILTTDLPENRRILDECDCGWLIADWAPPALAGHIKAILLQPAEMREKGANGRSWFERRYNWDVESASVRAVIEALSPANAQSSQ
jgi:glycosyltransferase involved in cell wall biosynthesis